MNIQFNRQIIKTEQLKHLKTRTPTDCSEWINQPHMFSELHFETKKVG